MENLMEKLKTKAHGKLLDYHDHTALIRKLAEVQTSRYKNAHKAIQDWFASLDSTSPDKRMFIVVIKANDLYELLLEANVHVGLFAATAFIYYKHYYNNGLRVVLPDANDILHEDGQDTFNFLLQEIIKAEVGHD